MPDASVIHGDCLEVMRGMDAASVDAIVTDPPYGLNFPYNQYVDTRESLEKLISGFVPDAIRIAKKRVLVLCGPTQIGMYPQPEWVGCVTWNTTGSHGKYGFNQWTPILFYGKDRKGFGSVDGVLKSDTVHISGGGGVGFMRSKEEKKHTCPKPLNMMRAVLKRFLEPGSTVLDPFAGSGSTGVAAMLEGFNFVGIELNAEYVDIARARIANSNQEPIYA